MKHKMKLVGIVISLFFCIGLLRGQNLRVVVKEKMDDVFALVNKNKIETGLLSDYGYLLVEPYAYNGVLTDTNYVSPEIWKGLYQSMYTTRINGNANLKDPEQVFNTLRPDAPTLLYLQYNRLDENAIDKGLLTFENERLRETGRSGSPYLKKELFAVAFPDICSNTPQVTFAFRKENYINNLQEIPAQIYVCFGTETVYRLVAWDKPVNYTFTSFGKKEIKVRIRLNDGKTLESHAWIKVSEKPVQFAVSDKIDAEFNIAPTSGHSGGKVQIKYATFNNEKKKLIRPLIIADESDILKFINNEDINLDYWFGNKGTNKIIESVNQLYDIVYVDNNDSFDDIFRNARLFEDAIVQINSMRSNICDQSYVVGLGMGGLVARYALRELENRGINHDVCKFITVNSPHKGFNISLGLQGMVRHLRGVSQVEESKPKLWEKLAKLELLLNQTAIKQMLNYSVDNNFNIRSEHTAFMQKYEAMGMPVKCRNVAISNGSYQGIHLFPEGELLFDYSKVVKDFWIGEVKFDIRYNALKSKKATQIYYGDLYYHKHIIFWDLEIGISKKTFDSTNDMVALDSAPGSWISVKSFLDKEEDQEILESFKVFNFCFVPTASALAVTDWEKYLLNRLPPGAEISCFDKLYGLERNNEYTGLESCKNFLLQELAPQISGNNKEMVGDTHFELTNIPKFFKLIPSSLLRVEWQLSDDNFRVVSSSGFEAVVTPVRFLKVAYLTAKITIKMDGREISYETLPVSLFSHDFKLTGSSFISPVARRYSVSGVPSGAALTWKLAPNLEVVEKRDNYIVIRDKSDKNTFNDLWIEANLNSQGNVVTDRMNLKRVRVERVELECLQNKVVNINGEQKRRFIYQVSAYPKDLPQDETNICWAAYAYTKKGFFKKYVDLDARTYEGACYSGSPFEKVDSYTPPVKRISLEGSPVAQPDNYDFYSPGRNSIVVYVPPCSGDSIFGSLKVTVDDSYKSSVVANASIWNYYVSVYHASPNPCSTTLTVSRGIPENGVESRSRTAGEPLVVNLYTDLRLVRSVEAATSQSDIRMDVSDLPEGTYYLNILKNGQLVDRQVVFIKH